MSIQRISNKSSGIIIKMGPLKPAQKPATVLVVRKNDDSVLRINKRDYGTQAFQEIDYDLYYGEESRGSASAPPKLSSSYTKAELSVMTLGKLQETPEASRLEKGSYKNKSELVAQILEVRESLVVKEPEAPAMAPAVLKKAAEDSAPSDSPTRARRPRRDQKE